MWKNFAVVIGGAILAITVPIVALAVTTDPTPAIPGHDPAAVEIQDQDQDQVQLQLQLEQEMQMGDPTETAVQDMTQRRLRVHAETGPPEGFEPIQQRLHQQTQQQIHQQTQDGSAGGRQPMVNRGNPDAPMVGTGECVQEDGPLGSGPHGGRRAPGN